MKSVKKGRFACPFCGHREARARPLRPYSSVDVGVGVQTTCERCKARGPAAELDSSYLNVLLVWSAVSRRVHK